MTEITAILPVHNQADCLGETLASLLEQTLDDLELILVDDGSTDHLEAVLETWWDHRLTVLHQDHAGLPRALNRGLARAQGRFVTWIGGGDVLLPRCLERLRDAIVELTACGAARADYVIIDGVGNPLTAASPAPFVPDGRYDFGPAFLIRRQVVDRVGPFDERLGLLAGRDYAVRVGLAARVASLPQVLYLHRRGTDIPAARMGRVTHE